MWKMINIRTCFLRNGVLRKFQLFNSHTPAYGRLFSNLRFYHREINEKVEDRFRNEDSMSRDYRIIYRAPYVKYVRLCYGFTTISISIVIPMVGSALLTSGLKTYPVMFGALPLLNSSFDLVALVGTITLVITQVCYVVFKYPYRIYHNSTNGKYIAIYQHLLPWKKHKEEFYAGEVKKIVKSYSIWHECLYQVKNKRAILLEDHFYLPQDFNDMCCFDEKKDN